MAAATSEAKMVRGSTFGSDRDGYDREEAEMIPRMTDRTFSTRSKAEFEKRVDPNNKEQMSLLEEMRKHNEKLKKMQENEDPRLSFATPEFRDAQRVFTENFKKNFGRPVEWGLVKKYPWSQAQLVKLDHPVDVDGKPWPLDDQGKPIV